MVKLKKVERRGSIAVGSTGRRGPRSPSLAHALRAARRNFSGSPRATRPPGGARGRRGRQARARPRFGSVIFLQNGLLHARERGRDEVHPGARRDRAGHERALGAEPQVHGAPLPGGGGPRGEQPGELARAVARGAVGAHVRGVRRFPLPEPRVLLHERHDQGGRRGVLRNASPRGRERGGHAGGDGDRAGKRGRRVRVRGESSFAGIVAARNRKDARGELRRPSLARTGRRALRRRRRERRRFVFVFGSVDRSRPSVFHRV